MKEGDLFYHHRYGIVKFFDTMGKLTLVKTLDGEIVGVQTRLLHSMNDIVFDETQNKFILDYENT